MKGNMEVWSQLEKNIRLFKVRLSLPRYLLSSVDRINKEVTHDCLNIY